MQSNRTLTSLVLVLAAAVVPASRAVASELIGTFDDWSAFTEVEKSGKACFIGTTPKKEQGDYTKRGKTYVLVTHRPAEKTFNVVSVRAGYTYKSGSEVVMNIDGKDTALFTDGGYAWARDAATDRALVAAMKAGKTLVVKGTSSRDTVTTDTYSLSGFTAAKKAADKACGVK